MKNIYSTNMQITKNLIKFANKNNVSIIFFLSSIAVYGSINQNIIFENQKPINPNLYEKSKFFSEKLLCNENNKFNTICLRIPGVFTINLNNDYPLIIKMLKKITNNENVNIYNPNKKFNNIIDINEVVRFINFALKKRRVKRGIYNFSASNPIKFIHVTKLIKKIFRSKSKIINKKSSKKSFIISNKKILNNLNFKTSTTKKIISRCCNNILDKNYN
jgi:nucleoside-diphosphate-sugar epimerase